MPVEAKLSARLHTVKELSMTSAEENTIRITVEPEKKFGGIFTGDANLLKAILTHRSVKNIGDLFTFLKKVCGKDVCDINIQL